MVLSWGSIIKGTSLKEPQGSAGENSFVKNRFIKSNEKNKGSAKGVKVVSQKQPEKILKQKKIDASKKKPLDGTNYERGRKKKSSFNFQ